MTSTTFQIADFFVVDSVSLKCQPLVSKLETDSTDDVVGESQLGTFRTFLLNKLEILRIPEHP